MILIIGGAYHNKLSYALKAYNMEKDDLADGSSCNINDPFSKKGIYNLHMIIKRYMQEGLIDNENYKYLIENIKSSQMEIIICDEIGSGVIPLERHEREYRDLVGNIVSQISEISQQVIRVYYGIPTILKG